MGEDVKSMVSIRIKTIAFAVFIFVSTFAIFFHTEADVQNWPSSRTKHTLKAIARVIEHRNQVARIGLQPNQWNNAKKPPNRAMQNWPIATISKIELCEVVESDLEQFRQAQRFGICRGNDYTSGIGIVSLPTVTGKMFERGDVLTPEAIGPKALLLGNVEGEPI
ncbi:hypothetical protein [Gloeobacter morelensis]|uniref:hypothetical protein n=1 Tax=Gloeobacter morelensis TaxID=2907343 RepID=UPI001E2F9899|nr:hypothetical protein [Gloeobacter morelensis]UFP97170.1 hypothetical protein ISF26_23910 [Gloeobacter morelensis MG652769]